jgi:hypothetical protein
MNLGFGTPSQLTKRTRRGTETTGGADRSEERVTRLWVGGRNGGYASGVYEKSGSFATLMRLRIARESDGRNDGEDQKRNEDNELGG